MEFATYHEDVAGYLLDGGPHSGLPQWLGIRHTEVGPGRLVATLEVRDDLMNSAGTLHGGVVSAMTDHVLGACVYPVIEKGSWAATTEFKINLTRSVTSGTLTAVAEVVSLTRSFAVVRIDITRDDGALVAAAQGSVTIVRDRR